MSRGDQEAGLRPLDTLLATWGLSLILQQAAGISSVQLSRRHRPELVEPVSPSIVGRLRAHVTITRLFILARRRSPCAAGAVSRAQPRGALGKGC